MITDNCMVEPHVMRLAWGFVLRCIIPWTLCFLTHWTSQCWQSLVIKLFSVLLPTIQMMAKTTKKQVPSYNKLELSFNSICIFFLFSFHSSSSNSLSFLSGSFSSSLLDESQCLWTACTHFLSQCLPPSFWAEPRGEQNKLHPLLSSDRHCP